jgi:hypothetical protein
VAKKRRPTKAEAAAKKAAKVQAERWEQSRYDWLHPKSQPLDLTLALARLSQPEKKKRRKSVAKGGALQEYDVSAIETAAKECLKRGVDNKQAWFAERVANELKERSIKKPKPTRFKAIIGPIYRAAKSKL